GGGRHGGARLAGVQRDRGTLTRLRRRSHLAASTRALKRITVGRRFENILETVGRTPVVKVAKLAPPGVELFVKLEAFNPLGSVKDRLALGGIEAAGRSGGLKAEG